MEKPDSFLELIKWLTSLVWSWQKHWQYHKLGMAEGVNICNKREYSLSNQTLWKLVSSKLLAKYKRPPPPFFLIFFTKYIVKDSLYMMYISHNYRSSTLSQFSTNVMGVRKNETILVKMGQKNKVTLTLSNVENY